MNEIMLFQYNGNEVRTFKKNGEPWWVASDVCKILGLKSKAYLRLDEDEKGVDSISTLGGTQEMVTINEAGLNALVIRCRKPEAKPFIRWITHEVLPSIRKTGAYVAPTTTQVAQSIAPKGSLVSQVEMLLAVVKQQEAIEQQQAKQTAEIQATKKLAKEAVEIASGDTGFCTVLGYARRLGVHLPLQKAQSIGRTLGKYSRENKLPVGQCPDGRHGYVGQYLDEALSLHEYLFLDPHQ